MASSGLTRLSSGASAAAVLLASCLPAWASDATSPAAAWKRIKVPGYGAVLLQVPATWKIQAIQLRSGSRRIELGPAAGKTLPVIIDLLPGHPLDPQTFRTASERERDDAVETAGEKNVPVLELRGDKVLGYYFTFAPKDPARREWRYVTRGSIAIDDVALPFRIDSEERSSPVVRQALDILRTARKEASAQEQPPDNPVPAYTRVSVPGVPWNLLLDLPGYRPVLDETRPDGSGAMFQAENTSAHMLVSAFIEVSPPRDSVGACRNALWERAVTNSPPRESVRETKAGEAIEIHYDVGGAPRQRHVDSYRFYAGACIDIHVTSTSAEAGDDGTFRALLDAVRIDGKDAIDVLQDMQRQ